MSLPEPELPEIYADMLAKLEPEIAAAGVNSMEAKAAARRVIDLIRREWGGRQHYLPRGTYYDVEFKRRAIGEQWNGKNTAELMRLFDIGERRLRELHAEYKASIHGDLFEPRARA